MDEKPTHKTIFGEVPELKHNPDGSGTRETNPLYHGKYTIEDYETDGKIPAKEMFEGPRERYDNYNKYDVKFRQRLASYDAAELTRYEAARRKAIRRYTGQKEWPHGYSLDYVIENHVITVGRYFLHYFELSDDKLADAMDSLISEYADVAAQMSANHETVLAAMDEDTEWPEMLEKANRALQIVGHKGEWELGGKEDLAKLTVQGAWKNWMWWEGAPDRLQTPKDWMEQAKSLINVILYTFGRTADAIEHLNALGEAYGPLMAHIKKEHGKDWTDADRISFEDMEWAIIETLDYGENPPETITPEIEQRIREIIDELGRPLREAIAKLEEDARRINEEWDARDAQRRMELENYPMSNTVPRFLAEDIIDDPKKRLLIQHNNNNRNLRKSAEMMIQSKFESDGWISAPVPMTKKDKVRIITKLFKDNPDDRPSDLDLDFATQLGMYLQKREEKGEPNEPISVMDLVQLYYCVPDDKDVGDEQIEDMISRMKKLERIWITIEKDPRTLPPLPPEDKKSLETLIGVKSKMLSFKELEYVNVDRKTRSKKYLFLEIPPMWTINQWVNLYTLTDRALIVTPAYHFEGETDEAKAWRDLQIIPEVRERIIDHYQKEKMQMDRALPGLYLHRYKTRAIKGWILQKLAMSINYHEAHKRGPKIAIDLEEAYIDIYDGEPPKKSSDKWRRFKVNFTMYLLYLILWGEIEDYTLKPKRADIDVTYTPKARKDIAGMIEGRYD